PLTRLCTWRPKRTRRACLAIPERFPAIEQSLKVRRRPSSNHPLGVAILCRAVCVAGGSLHHGSGHRSPLSLRAGAAFPSRDTRPTSPFDAPTLSGFCLSLGFIPSDAERPELG